MNRTGAGILTFVMLMALLAGSGSRSMSSSTGGVIAPPQGSRERTSRKSRAEQTAAAQPCQIGEDTFQFKLIDAVRSNFSRGTAINDRCAEDFHIDESQAKRAKLV